MKNDLLTAIATAILGGIVGFIVCNLFFGEIKPITVETIDSNINTNLAFPDEEVFNATAINPTVESYVGNSQDEIITEGNE